MNRIKPGGRSQGSHRSHYSSTSRRLPPEKVRDHGPVRFPTSKSSGNVTNASQAVPQTGSNTILSMVADSLSKNALTGGYQYLQPGWFNNSSNSSEYSTNYNNTALQGYGYQASAPPANANSSFGQNSYYGGGEDSTLVGLEQRMAEIQKELDTLQQEEIMEQVQQTTTRPFPDQGFFQDPATQERREKELAKMNRILQQQHGRMSDERPSSPVRAFPGPSRDYHHGAERTFAQKRRSPVPHSRLLPPARSPPPLMRRESPPRRRDSPPRRKESPRRREDRREPSWKAAERSQPPRRMSPPPQKRRKISHEETSRHTSVSSSSRRSEKKEDHRERRRQESSRRPQHSRSSTRQPKEDVRRSKPKEDEHRQKAKEDRGDVKERAPKKVIKLDKVESSRRTLALEAISTCLKRFTPKDSKQCTVVDSTKFGEPVPSEGTEVSLGEILKEMRLDVPLKPLSPASRLPVKKVLRISPPPEKKSCRLFEVCSKPKLAAQ